MKGINGWLKYIHPCKSWISLFKEFWMVVWCMNIGCHCQGNSAKLFESVLCLNSVILELQLQTCYTHQCSFLRCGPVRNHHHTHSGTSLEGSGTFQTHRCSGNYTHRCLWQRWQREREREKLLFTLKKNSKKKTIKCDRISAAPWQALLSSVGVKPISHSQR